MNKYLKTIIMTVSLLGSFASLANADALSISAFKRDTGIHTDANQVQSVWNDLKAMGTDKYLGGTIGSFRLDEASMIAGALTLGVTEFDSFLKTGKLGSSLSSLGNILSKNMSSAAGIDLSSITGSYTSLGGQLSDKTASLSNTTGATTGGSCDPAVAQNFVDAANAKIKATYDVAMSDEFGFSQISNGTAGSGFAGFSCLDKLFQNSGSDIMFKPPSLGQLTAQLQNWSCDGAVSVVDQVSGGLVQGFQTASHGGFFPHRAMGDAAEGFLTQSIGMGENVNIFGDEFAKFTRLSDKDAKEASSIEKLFR